LGPPGLTGKPGYPGNKGSNGASGQPGSDAQVKQSFLFLTIKKIIFSIVLVHHVRR
jgi:hypothetical protein